MIRVIVADDHPLIREGLRKITNSVDDIAIVGEAETVEELLHMVQERKPEVVSLDLTLRSGNGLDALQQLRRDHPGIVVLVVSMHEEERFALKALRAGAAGYVCKNMAAEEVVKALRRVSSGARYISPRVAELLADSLSPDHTDPAHEALTPREQEVLRLLGSGLRPKQAAAALGISLSSVNTYRMRIADKTGLNTNAAIIRYAIQKGLVS